MIEAEFLELVDNLLAPAGLAADGGETFSQPRLEILLYYRKPVKLGRLPLIGRGLSLVIVLRQAEDVEGDAPGLEQLLARAAMAVNGRYPPWQGWVVGLVPLILTTAAITPADEEILPRLMARPLPPRRVLLTGLFRINLNQEAVSFAITAGPANPFTEAELLADGLSQQLKRFLPLLER